MEKHIAYVFGHSFPTRLSRVAQSRHQSVKVLLGVPDCCDVRVEGHPGLSYPRIFDSLTHCLRGMGTDEIDLLCIDMGTNDLCSPSNTSSSCPKYVEVP